MKQWEKAKRNFEDALVLYQQLNDRENISWVYNDLGINQELEAQETGQADYARILSWYKEAMQLNEALQAKQGLGWVYNNVGRMYCKLNQPVQALEYLQKAEPLLKEAQDYPNLVIMYTRKGEAYRQLGKFTEALELLKKAEQLEGKVAGSDKEKIGETYKVLQEVYAALQDQAKVRLYQEKEQALAQQVAQIREKGQVAHLQNQIIADQAEKFFFVRALSYANGENLRKQVMLVATITIAVLLLIALIGSIFYLVRLTRKTAVLEEFVFIISGGKTQNRRMRK
jgi:tetratricopeptide (TPR) repeat protein